MGDIDLSKLKILAVIPTRSGSKGVPRKNIRELAGKPLIAYTIEEALKSKMLDRVIVSTEDRQIASIAKKYGAEVPFMRPKKLAEDKTPTLPVIQHAVRFLQRKESYYPDYVVILQATAPLRKSRHIDEALELLIESGADSIVSVCETPYQHNPYFTMRIVNGQLLFFMNEGIHYTRRQDLPKVYTRNGAIYAFKREIISVKNSIYGDNCIPYVMKAEESINIDSVLDFKLAEVLIMEEQHKASKK